MSRRKTVCSPCFDCFPSFSRQTWITSTNFGIENIQPSLKPPPIRRTLLPPSFVRIKIWSCKGDLQSTGEDMCWLWKCFLSAKKNLRTSWFQAMFLRPVPKSFFMTWLVRTRCDTNSHGNLGGKNSWGNMLVQKKLGWITKKTSSPQKSVFQIPSIDITSQNQRWCVLSQLVFTTNRFETKNSNPSQLAVT